MEIWKDIQGYEGCYQISNYGRVKNLSRLVPGKLNSIREIAEKILAPRYDSHHCYRVVLHKDGKRHEAKVHRLVAQAFIPNTDNKPFINHIDGNPLNNIITNLEWCTPSENVSHAFRTGLAKAKRGVNHPGIRPVFQFSLDGKLIRRFDYIRQAADETSIREEAIAQCLRGHNKTSGGYKWQYA